MELPGVLSGVVGEPAAAEAAAADHRLPAAPAARPAKAAGLAPRRLAFAAVAVPARLVTRLAPRRVRYRLLFLLAGFLSGAAVPLAALAKGRPPRDAIRVTLLGEMLTAATRAGGVDVPVAVERGELIEDTLASHGKVLLLTAHLGLTSAIHGALRARNIVTKVIGAPDASTGGRHWGSDRPLEMIEADRSCLMLAREALSAGCAVVVYPDYWGEVEGLPTKVVRPNIFHFAVLTATPVLFFGATLGADGTIRIDVVRPERWRPAAGDAGSLLEEYCSFLAARTRHPCTSEPLRWPGH